jgi:hypothetical protein
MAPLVRGNLNRWLGVATLATAVVAGYSLFPLRRLSSGSGSPVSARTTSAVASSPDSNFDLSDSYDDGTPDGLRLQDESDRQIFRRWFAFLAESQYFAPGTTGTEIGDCAALLRFAYREALRHHDANWAASLGLPVTPELGNIAQYDYPHTPLGAALFRIRTGSFLPQDLHSGAFAEFADANSLRRFNTYFVSRDIRLAQRGDLLFFYQPGQRSPYHAMIYLGRSQLEQRPESFVVYHTGPMGKKVGELRRLSVGELLAHPLPRWRPLRENPAFLGVYRWTILRGAN